MTAPADGPVAQPRAQGSSRAAGASALWRDMAGGAAADPGFAWALVVGVVLIGLGLLGFVPNPLVGSPSAAWGTPLLLTGDAHDVLHLVGGAVAIHAALGMSRARRDGVLIGLGAAALILLALGLLDGRWFGITPYAVGLTDQLLHLVVGLGSLVMGLAGTGTITVPVVTGAYRRSELGAASTAAPSRPVPAGDGAAEAASSPGPESPEVMPEPLGLELDEPEPVAHVEPEPFAPELDEPVEPVEPEPLGLELDEPGAPKPAAPEPAAPDAAVATEPHPATDAEPAPTPHGEANDEALPPGS